MGCVELHLLLVGRPRHLIDAARVALIVCIL